MKKFLAIILAAVLLLCLVGCKKEEEANAAGDDEELHGIEELVYNNFVYDVNEEGDYELVPYYPAGGTEGENPVWTAFVFERRGRSYALIWHNTGSARLTISLEDAKYERELGGEELPIEIGDGSITIKISDSAYLYADISLQELKKKLASAKIV